MIDCKLICKWQAMKINKRKVCLLIQYFVKSSTNVWQTITVTILLKLKTTRVDGICGTFKWTTSEIVQSLDNFVSFYCFLFFGSLVLFRFTSMFSLEKIVNSLIYSISIWMCVWFQFGSMVYLNFTSWNVKWLCVSTPSARVAFSCRSHSCRLCICSCYAILISIPHRITLLLLLFYFIEFSINVNRFTCWFWTVGIKSLKYSDVLTWIPYNT